jgi:hypothetical protein
MVFRFELLILEIIFQWLLMVNSVIYLKFNLHTQSWGQGEAGNDEATSGKHLSAPSFPVTPISKHFA